MVITKVEFSVLHVARDVESVLVVFMALSIDHKVVLDDKVVTGKLQHLVYLINTIIQFEILIKSLESNEIIETLDFQINFNRKQN